MAELIAQRHSGVQSGEHQLAKGGHFRLQATALGGARTTQLSGKKVSQSKGGEVERVGEHYPVLPRGREGTGPRGRGKQGCVNSDAVCSRNSKKINAHMDQVVNLLNRFQVVIGVVDNIQPRKNEKCHTHVKIDTWIGLCT